MKTSTICRRPARQPTTFHGIVTAAPQMLDFFSVLQKVARTQATVLIRGDSGTGKELAARVLHELSPRKGGPFKAINCATLTPELLASELFGHVRGAFTGAIKDRHGLFALADRGTIFLDEIAEMPLDIQARLLRVLQERTFIPLGGTEHVDVDVRVLSATNKALRYEVQERRFREDLMYRVRVVPLFLPRLAERDGDVEILTWHFVDGFNAQGYRNVEQIEGPALEVLLDYPWPGNVRELRNAIEHAFVIGEGPTLRLSDLPPELRGEQPEISGQRTSESELERRQILDALRKCRGRKGVAAELLGISRTTLWRKLREYDIA
ncbi:MAG: sigma-54-dependent Fis family transcriptional regulator [Myxococcales bacterium]|nr:sigma-54-dependent Fis family transcriptional regulator [Myxococcales bacterium]